MWGDFETISGVVNLVKQLKRIVGETCILFFFKPLFTQRKEKERKKWIDNAHSSREQCVLDLEAKTILTLSAKPAFSFLSTVIHVEKKKEEDGEIYARS